jgi:ferredoxin
VAEDLTLLENPRIATCDPSCPSYEWCIQRRNRDCNEAVAKTAGREEQMKVEVDALKCETAGICVQQCPEVFRFQEGSKKAVAMNEEIPVALQEKCRKVADLCPAKAIRIRE